MLSQEIGWEECLRNDLFCVKCEVKPLINQSRSSCYDYLLQQSQLELPSDIDLDIFLVNGYKVTVNIKSMDKTNDVLEVTVEFI